MFKQQEHTTLGKMNKIAHPHPIWEGFKTVGQIYNMMQGLPVLLVELIPPKWKVYKKPVWIGIYFGDNLDHGMLVNDVVINAQFSDMSLNAGVGMQVQEVSGLSLWNCQGAPLKGDMLLSKSSIPVAAPVLPATDEGEEKLFPEVEHMEKALGEENIVNLSSLQMSILENHLRELLEFEFVAEMEIYRDKIVNQIWRELSPVQKYKLIEDCNTDIRILNAIKKLIRINPIEDPHWRSRWIDGLVDKGFAERDYIALKNYLIKEVEACLPSFVKESFSALMIEINYKIKTSKAIMKTLYAIATNSKWNIDKKKDAILFQVALLVHSPLKAEKIEELKTTLAKACLKADSPLSILRKQTGVGRLYRDEYTNDTGTYQKVMESLQKIIQQKKEISAPDDCAGISLKEFKQG